MPASFCCNMHSASDNRCLGGWQLDTKLLFAKHSLHLLSCAAPTPCSLLLQTEASQGRHPVIAWHPDGSLLAVPGADGEVEALERLNWEPRFTLAGEHEGPVNLAAFSPNGQRLALACSAGMTPLWAAAALPRPAVILHMWDARSFGRHQRRLHVSPRRPVHRNSGHGWHCGSVGGRGQGVRRQAQVLGASGRCVLASHRQRTGPAGGCVLCKACFCFVQQERFVLPEAIRKDQESTVTDTLTSCCPLCAQDEAGALAVWADPVPEERVGPAVDPDTVAAADADVAKSGNEMSLFSISEIWTDRSACNAGTSMFHGETGSCTTYQSVHGGRSLAGAAQSFTLINAVNMQHCALQASALRRVVRRTVPSQGTTWTASSCGRRRAHRLASHRWTIDTTCSPKHAPHHGTDVHSAIADSARACSPRRCLRHRAQVG